jgi:hypothetical protein
MKPQIIDDVTIAFPARVTHLMPKYEDIPQEFRDRSSKWCRFQSDWFYGGINIVGLIPCEGIDTHLALRHLSAIQGSFEPKHEYKAAAVAYLASLWFTDESTWETIKGKV